MPPTESQEVQITSPNKKFLTIGFAVLVLVVGTTTFFALRGGVPKATQEEATSTIPLSDEERAVLEERIKNDTQASPLSQEDAAVLEKRIKDNVSAPPLSEEQRTILEARINDQSAQ